MSDNLSEAQAKYVINTALNWAAYKYQTEGVAYYYNATGIMEGTEVRPPNAAGGAAPDVIAAATVLQESWDKRNRKMFHYFLTTQSPASSPYISQVAAGNTPGMWTGILSQHQSGTRAQAVNAIDRALSTRLENTVAHFISELQSRRQELASIRVQLAVANAVGGAVQVNLEDLLITAVLLRGLNREFDLTTERLHSVANLDWDQASAAILQKDEQIRYERQRKGLKANQATAGEDASALQAIKAQFTGSPPKGSGAGVVSKFHSPNAKCTHCGKPNHVALQCFELHPELKVEFEASRAAKAAARKTLTGGANSAVTESEMIRRHEEVFGGGGGYSCLMVGDIDENELSETLPAYPQQYAVSDEELTSQHAIEESQELFYIGGSALRCQLLEDFEADNEESAVSPPLSVDIASVSLDPFLPSDNNAVIVFCDTLCLCSPAKVFLKKKLYKRRVRLHAAISAGSTLRPLWTGGYQLVPFKSSIGKALRERRLAYLNSFRVARRSPRGAVTVIRSASWCAARAAARRRSKPRTAVIPCTTLVIWDPHLEPDLRSAIRLFIRSGRYMRRDRTRRQGLSSPGRSTDSSPREPREQWRVVRFVPPGWPSNATRMECEPPVESTTTPSMWLDELPALIDNSDSDDDDGLPHAFYQDNYVDDINPLALELHALRVSAHRRPDREPGYLVGPLDSGASHLFLTEDMLPYVTNFNSAAIKRVRIANGDSITTIGCGTLNGMAAHLGPFRDSLISVPALLTIGVRSFFDLVDPYMLLPSGERYGEVTYSENDGFWAKIPISAINSTPTPFLANNGTVSAEPDDLPPDQIVPVVPGAQLLRVDSYPLNTGSPRVVQMTRLHRIFHASARRLVSGVNKGHLVGSTTRPLLQDIEVKDALQRCMGCELGKCRRPSHSKRGDRSKSTILFQRIFFDTKTFAYPSWAGNFVMGIIVEDKSGYIFLLYARSRHDMQDELERFEGQVVRALGHKLFHIQFFRTDNAAEFLSERFDTWMTEIGCHQELTVPHTPEQNRAERKIESVMDLARTIRITNNFPKGSWEEVTKTAAFLENRLPSLANPNEAPAYTVLHDGRPVDTSDMHEIGCRATLHIDHKEEGFDKYGLAGRPAILIGYAEHRAGWRFLIDRHGSIQETDRATFFDKWFDPLSPVVTECVVLGSQDEIDSELDYMFPATVLSLPVGAVVLGPPVAAGPPLVQGVAGRGRRRPAIPPAPRAPIEPSPRVSAVPRVRGPPNRLGDWVYPGTAHQAIDLEPSSPQALSTKMSYSEAVYKPACIRAMTKEVADLTDNKKVVVQLTPPGRHPIGSTWAYKEKSAVEDRGTEEELYKARLCPQGFSQKAGVDYDPKKIASPTISLLALMVLNHICLHRKMYLAALDFIAAFSNVPLKEEIYMRAPPGVVLPPGYSLLLKNSLQGTKQAAYNWFAVLSEFLLSIGFRPYTVEPAMFYRFTGESPHQTMSMIGVHIDDLRCAFDKVEDFETFHKQCNDWLPCTRTNGERYVGIDTPYDRDAGTMFVSQKAFLQETLERFNMVDCNPCSTPAAPGSKLSKNPNPSTDEDVLDFPLRDLVGCVLWSARCSMPETLYAVGQVGAHAHNFNATHVIAGKRILRYLKGRLDHTIRLRRNPVELVMEAATDADFMGETEESLTPCRSTSSVVLSVRGQGFLYAESSLQPTVSHSTEEAEYRAAGKGVRLIRIARNLFEESGYPQPATPMDQDNQACLSAATSATCSNKLRHIRNDHHMLREGFVDKVVDPRYCPTVDMVADIGTKALPKVDFQRHTERLHYGFSSVPAVITDDGMAAGSVVIWPPSHLLTEPVLKLGVCPKGLLEATGADADVDA